MTRVVRVKIEGDAASAVSAFDEASRAGEKFQSKFTSVGQTLKDIGSTLSTRVSLPIVGLGTLAAREAINFETEISNVNKVLDLTEEQLQQFGNTVKGLSLNIPKTTTELNEIAEAGARLGVKFQDLEEFTSDVAIASTALDISAAETSKKFGTLANVFGFALTNVEDLAATINILDANMATNAADILEVTNRTAGMAKVFGLTEHETSALGAAMLSLGRTPEVAATGINALLAKMQNATLGAGRFQEGLKLIGISAEELERRVREDADQAIIDFLKTLDQLDSQTQSQAIGLLFGQQYADDISLLVSGIGELEKAYGLAADRGAAMTAFQREFEVRNQTTANQLQLLRNNLSVIAIEIGSALLPAINSIVQALRPALTGFAEFAQAHPGIVQVGVAIAAVVAAIGPLLVVAGSVISAITTIAGALGSLSGLITGVSTVATATISIITAPITGLVALIVGAVGVIGYNIYLLVTKWEDFKLATIFTLQQAWNAISGFGQSVAGLLGSVWSTITGLFGSIASFAFNAGRSLITGFISGIQQMAANLYNTVSGVVQRVRDFLPFSPAKVGALADLDQAGAGFIGTFAQGVMKNAPQLLQATDSVLQPVRESLSPEAPRVAGAGGGQVSINFSPTINIDGANLDNIDPDTLIELLRNQARELIEMLREEEIRFDKGNY